MQPFDSAPLIERYLLATNRKKVVSFSVETGSVKVLLSLWHYYESLQVRLGSMVPQIGGREFREEFQFVAYVPSCT